MRRMYGIPYTYLHEWLDFCMVNVGTSFFQVTRIDHPNGATSKKVANRRTWYVLLELIRQGFFLNNQKHKTTEKMVDPIDILKKQLFGRHRYKIPRGLNLNRWFAMKYYCISRWWQLKYFFIFTPNSPGMIDPTWLWHIFQNGLVKNHQPWKMVPKKALPGTPSAFQVSFFLGGQQLYP